MSATYKLAVVFNPRSANGRTGAQWPVLERALRDAFGAFTPLRTERPGHAIALTHEALDTGHDRILSVGGDGTHWEVVNGFFRGTEAINRAASLGILSQGTGSDLARTLAIPRGVKAVPALAPWKTARVDLGRIVYTSHAGERETAYFINSAHLGMGGAVMHRVNRTTKRWGGFASYLWGTLATLATFKNVPLELDIDGVALEQVCRDVIAANGQYDGGGMHMAPQASLDSGFFEVYVIGDISRADTLRSLPLLYKGQLEKRPDVIRHFRACTITARSHVDVPITLDGEQPGGLPASIEIVPAALSIVLPI